MGKRLLRYALLSALLLGSAGCSNNDQEAASSSGNYGETIFDTSYVHEINVEIAEADWEDLVENPTDKTKYTATVTIDGTTVENVSFATKGNTSLSTVAASDSDRYSFKLNFGKYEEGQTYDGLDKLNLNNAYSDNSYLKDYISYRIMAEAGADAPLVSFVSLSVNGEERGLYIAIEEVGDAFLERNYGTDAGELYKPETEQLADMGDMGAMGDQNTGDMPEVANGEPPAQGELPDLENMPNFDEENMPARDDMDGGMGAMGSMDAAGADLAYSDDELSSYSAIFDNAETAADEADNQRVVEALKQLSTGEDLASAIDVEQVLRYFTAHNFVLNFDSYTGNMLHNYYLYEDDGVLSLLPWDYNLAFGGYGGVEDAEEAVNYPIDSPLASGTDEADRPMWGQLAANEEYLEQYHDYFAELLSGYFESGRFAEEIEELSELIRPYVAEDPTAFCTVDEFDTAVETLKSFCQLRAESIRQQLAGTIPTTAAGQQADSSKLIDAGELELADMGVMDMGGGFAGENTGFPGKRDETTVSEGKTRESKTSETKTSETTAKTDTGS